MNQALNDMAQQAAEYEIPGTPSFVVTDLAVSPDGGLVAAATDSSRHFVYHVGTSRLAATLSGHVVNRDMLTRSSRLSWHPSGEFVYGNGGAEHQVLLWSLHSERIVAKLAGHEGMVRDLSCVSTAPDAKLLVTASYDKTLRVWL